MKPSNTILIMSRKLVSVLSRIFFFLGVFVGFALAVVLIWNKVEAIHYYFKGEKYEQFNGLLCPLIIAPTEKGAVTATFTNPTEKAVNFYYRAEVSGPLSTRRVEDDIAVPAHQTKSIQLIVDANDVDLLYFIFVKINILPNSLQGAGQSVCGIRVMNILGFAGKQLPAIALSISFLGMAIGLSLEHQTGNRKDRALERVMQVLGVIVLLTLLAGTVGWWLPGMALSAVTVLLLLISARLVIA